MNFDKADQAGTIEVYQDGQHILIPDNVHFTLKLNQYE